MRLKTRISQILSICLAANVLLGLIVQKWVVLPSFRQLELQEAERVARRCIRAVDQEIEHLNTVCGDWSNWNEMYAFAVDRRQEFVDSSLEVDSLVNLGLDYLYIADAQKRFLRGVSLAPDIRQIAGSEEFEEFFGAAGAMLVSPCETEKAVTGLVSTRGGPMMISARSILPSDHTGPTRGVLVMGRLLNETLVKDLGVRTCTELRHQALPDLSRNDVVRQLRAGGFPHVRVDGEQLQVSSLMSSILGEPAVLIEAMVRRDIYEKGHIAGTMAMISIIVASVFFMVLTRFFMHSSVSRPIMGLADQVMSIASNPQTSASALRISRDDEIGLLSNQFHDCFAGLQYRDHLFNAVAEAAGGLLRESELGVALTSVTASLGEAMHADSVFVCRLDKAGPSQARVVLRASWSANPHSIPWSADELDSQMIAAMSRGKSIEGPVTSLSGQIRDVLVSQGVQSVLMVPIAAHDDLWGFIAFTSVQTRCWTDTEQALLWAIADSMGSAILRKETEDALLEARQVANDASRAKSDFLARMSHEIRTPMNGVLGMLDLLEKTTLDDRQQRYAQIAKTSATALLGIINDILDFSKIEAGKMELAVTEIDLWDVVQDAVGLLANRAAEKRLELVCDIKEDVPHRICGDALRLRQILVNLVSNAVKFTDSGTVSTEVRVERMAGRFVELRITVRDSGCGIRDDLQSKLFQVFSQVDSFGVRRFNGSGLGLVICKRLVEMMGGEIGVRSKAGSGSEFWFTAFFEVVSTARTGRPGMMSTWRAAMAKATIRVLAVDDNTTNREILRVHLSQWGFHVETAAGAAEALGKLHSAAAAGRSFSLAVLDMDMPGMTGLELAQSIKASDPLRRTALILLSSISELPSQQELHDCGFVAGLTKPVRQSDLFDAIVAAVPGAAVNREATPKQTQTVSPDGSVVALRRKARILVAEDNAINQEVIREILTQCGYGVQIVDNGEEALAILQDGRHRMVITDWEMPRMNGLELCRAIRGTEFAGYIYTIMLTSYKSTEQIVEGISAGADDFLVKPFDPEELAVRIRTGERILSLETRDMAIFAMAKLAESRDPETGKHLERVRMYARSIATWLAAAGRPGYDVDAQFVRTVYLTSPLHDIGKIGIPDSVLLKPPRLCDREFEVMKAHTTIGAETLNAALVQYPDAKFLLMARDIAVAHHERFDGTGYPYGLIGTQIPLSARIVALADVYDALTAKRVYKDVFEHDLATSMIREESGTHFDPLIVTAFDACEEEFHRVKEYYCEEPQMV